MKMETGRPGIERGEAGLPPRGTPKNYLMAWLLVMLKDLEPTWLRDHARPSRKLRSDDRPWNRISGPAATRTRRIHQFVAGIRKSKARPADLHADRHRRQALKLWSDALDQYRQNLDSFFSLYTGAWTKDVRQESKAHD